LRLPSLAESVASSGDLSRLPLPPSSVPSAILETRHDVFGNGNYAPSPLKAARTILTAQTQVKIPCWPITPLIYRIFLSPPGVAGTPSQRCTS
jgi:hypothetical protein